jgi:hypothetical protein
LGLKCRQDLPDLLPACSVVAELGVARGDFSEQLLKHRNVGHLYSIDAWAGDRGHDDKEYSKTVSRLSTYGNNTIIRAKFSEAVTRFNDGFFDLVYIDGYAHDGEDNGKTIRDWWKKVKGILAGHDYCDTWPLVVYQVNLFAKENELTVNTIPAEAGVYKFPSWYIVK